jgi:sugar phosphate isomerase/epimerase
MLPQQFSTGTTEHSRRRFMQATAATAAAMGIGLGAPARAAEPAAAAVRPSLKLGIASYSFRKFDLDKTLAMTKQVGLQYVCLKSFHLPLDATPEQIKEAAEKVAQAGLTLYAAGVITMHNEAQVEQAFAYAKTAGMGMIVAAPSAEMLPAIEKHVKQFDIAVAIHNHGPGDKHFPTPQSIYEQIATLDKRIGICIDIGHTVRIGADLLESTKKYADRIIDVHIKDVTEAAPKGHGIQAGRGIIDLPAFLRALRDIKYDGVVAFEYEEQPDDPLPGLAETIGYVRGVWAAI